jgi:multiple sugar transport system permease protein
VARLGDSELIAATSRRASLTAEQHARLASRNRRRKYITTLAFLAPDLFFFVLFLVLPVLGVFYYSFTSGTIAGATTFVGLKNWLRVGSDPLVPTAAWNTVGFALWSVPATVVLSLAIALALSKVGRLGSTLRAVIYFPALLPTAIAAVTWLFLVNPDFGIFDLVLRSLGQQQVLWLGNEQTALPSVALMDVWRNTGYWSVVFLAMVVGLPSELYEAAHLDGANIVQRFRYLTLPLLRRGITFVLVIATIYGLQAFDQIYILTGGGPVNDTVTMVWLIYNKVFASQQIGYGAVVSVLLLLAVLALTLAQMRFLRPRGGS